MATNKQRRDAERRRLQEQLAQRRAKELARRRFTLISSVVGTLVVIALIVVIIVAATSGGDDKKNNAAGAKTTTPAASTSAPTSASPSPVKTPGHAAAGATVSFEGVTVKGATDLTGYPVVTSKSTAKPSKVEYKDLVVGKGTAAKQTSTVTVQYTGVQYPNGAEFDSSWKTGSAVPFSLQQVVKGFTYGIGGTTGVPAMKVGGRRIIIMPAALGYPSGNAQAGIPANTPLVFVVDLVKVG